MPEGFIVSKKVCICVCVCVYTHTHLCMCSCICILMYHIYTYMCVQIYVDILMYQRIWINITCVCIHIYLCFHIYVHTYLHMYLHKYIHIYLCMYSYIHACIRVYIPICQCTYLFFSCMHLCSVLKQRFHEGGQHCQAMQPTGAAPALVLPVGPRSIPRGSGSGITDAAAPFPR